MFFQLKMPSILAAVLFWTVLPELLFASTDPLTAKVVLFPFRQATISSRVESTLESYHYKIGDAFETDAVLLQLDDAIYKQQLEKAAAALAEAQSSYDFSVSNVKRAEELLAKGVGGQQELEQAQLELEVNTSKLQFHQANYQLAQRDLDACKIVAPFAGRLIRKALQEHEFVRAGQPLLYIIDDRQLLAILYLPSQLKNQVKIGQEIEITVEETHTTHRAVVYEIAGEVDFNSRTFEIRALLPNRDGKLAAGMSGYLSGVTVTAGATPQQLDAKQAGGRP